MVIRSPNPLRSREKIQGIDSGKLSHGKGFGGRDLGTRGKGACYFSPPFFTANLYSFTTINHQPHPPLLSLYLMPKTPRAPLLSVPPSSSYEPLTTLQTQHRRKPARDGMETEADVTTPSKKRGLESNRTEPNETPSPSPHLPSPKPRNHSFPDIPKPPNNSYLHTSISVTSRNPQILHSHNPEFPDSRNPSFPRIFRLLNPLRVPTP